MSEKSLRSDMLRPPPKIYRRGLSPVSEGDELGLPTSRGRSMSTQTDCRPLGENTMASSYNASPLHSNDSVPASPRDRPVMLRRSRTAGYIPQTKPMRMNSSKASAFKEKPELVPLEKSETSTTQLSHSSSLNKPLPSPNNGLSQNRSYFFRLDPDQLATKTDLTTNTDLTRLSPVSDDGADPNSDHGSACLEDSVACCSVVDAWLTSGLKRWSVPLFEVEDAPSKSNSNTGTTAELGTFISQKTYPEWI